MNSFSYDGLIFSQPVSFALAFVTSMSKFHSKSND